MGVRHRQCLMGIPVVVPGVSEGCWQQSPWDRQPFEKHRAARGEHLHWQDAARKDGVKQQGGM